MSREVPRAVLLAIYEGRHDPDTPYQHAGTTRSSNPDLRPEVPTPNHDPNRHRSLDLPARVASRPREHARDAGKQPARSEDTPDVSCRGAVRREQDRVSRERDEGPRENEGTSRADAVGEHTHNDGRNAPRGIGRDGEELGSRCGEAEAGYDGGEEQGEGVAGDDEATTYAKGEGTIRLGWRTDNGTRSEFRRGAIRAGRSGPGRRTCT